MSLVGLGLPVMSVYLLVMMTMMMCVFQTVGTITVERVTALVCCVAFASAILIAKKASVSVHLVVKESSVGLMGVVRTAGCVWGREKAAMYRRGNVFATPAARTKNVDLMGAIMCVVRAVTGRHV